MWNSAKRCRACSLKTVQACTQIPFFSYTDSRLHIAPSNGSVLAAPSPTAELETAPRDSKSEAAEQQRFLAKFVMLVFSKPEIKNHFRTFPAKVEFSKPLSGQGSCFYGKPGFCPAEQLVMAAQAEDFLLQPQIPNIPARNCTPVIYQGKAHFPFKAFESQNNFYVGSD